LGETVKIRESTTQDHSAIREVHLNAFGQYEGPTVSQLAGALLSDETARPILSLVAEDDGEVVGSIIFSSVTITDHEGISAYILAPLAVRNERQGQGIGTELINSGLKMLKDSGAELVLVLGDPRYYSRSGFKADHKLEYPEAWMAREIRQGVLERVEGLVKCASSLESPEHW
jgi:predicted N-acetyltransferase YhbS